MTLEGTLYFDSKFCWDSNYYIDSSSKNVVELGTKQFPYKRINTALLEIFNLYTNNSNANIQLFIKEGT